MIRKAILSLCVVGTVGVLVIGVVSFWRGIPDNALWIPWTLDKPRFQAALVRGTIHAVYSKPGTPRSTTEFKYARAGFEVRRKTVGLVHATGIGIPFWPVVLLLACYPAVAACRGPLRRRRRRARGLCVRCGYDLRGLPEPRCPECGELFEPRVGPPHRNAPPPAGDQDCVPRPL